MTMVQQFLLVNLAPQEIEKLKTFSQLKQSIHKYTFIVNIHTWDKLGYFSQIFMVWESIFRYE